VAAQARGQRHAQAAVFEGGALHRFHYPVNSDLKLLEGELDDAEQELLNHLPAPPSVGEISTTNLWIVEWLSEGQKATGSELHEWLKLKRSGWSHLSVCRTKLDVIASIEEATQFAIRSGARPILHIEAHGNEEGLSPDTHHSEQFISWGELTPKLRELNVAAQCNLVLVCAACKGIAAMLSASSGDRIPCIAVIGPDSEVTPSLLLAAMKELYRGWMTETLDLETASREMAPAELELQSMVSLSYESFMGFLLRHTRPENQSEMANRLSLLLAHMGKPYDQSRASIEGQIALLPRRLQKAWKSLFMIDLYPENAERFGFDVKAAVWKVLQMRSLA
jgi:hypothetical protein